MFYAAGIYTGSVYNDRELAMNGFPGEGVVNSSVVLVKTHSMFGIQTRPIFSRVVLLIRNPYDAIFAEFNRRMSNHTGSASQSASQSRK